VTRSLAEKTIRRSSLSSPRSTRDRTSAAARNLKVLDIGKRSVLRQPAWRPLAVSSAATTQATADSAFQVGKRRADVVGHSRQRQQRAGKHRTARNRSRNGLLRPWSVAAYVANMARRGHSSSRRSN